jgi:hypothetical protein
MNAPAVVELFSERELMKRRLDDATYSARLEVAQARRFRTHVANALRTMENPNFPGGTLVRTARQE